MIGAIVQGLQPMGRSYGLSAEWLDITLYDDSKYYFGDKKRAPQERYIDVWTCRNIYTHPLHETRTRRIYLGSSRDVIVA
jgi:hypothetical protein